MSKDYLKIFQDKGALLEGHFLLSSGLHSGQYLQCARVLENPTLTQQLSQDLASKFKDDRISVVIGPAMGGVIISYELARALGVRAVFSERENGKMCLRRGFSLSADDKVLIAEDVITTGLSVREVIELVASKGVELVGIASIVERSKEKIDFPVKQESLLRIEVPTFSKETCPMCKKGSTPVKPGSRDSSFRSESSPQP